VGLTTKRRITETLLFFSGCRLNVLAMPGKNTPLLLEGNGRMTARGVPWLLPEKYGEDAVLSLAPGEEITVACPGQARNEVSRQMTIAASLRSARKLVGSCVRNSQTAIVCEFSCTDKL